MRFDPRWVIGTPLRVVPLAGWSMTEGAIRNMCRASPHVVGFDAAGSTGNFTDEHIRAFVRLAPRVEVISVAGCPLITDAGVLAVVDACGSSLCELDISDCPGITDRSVAAAARECAGLQVLKASHSAGVTDAGMALVAERCDGMRELHLAGNRSITDRSLEAAFERCASTLQSLVLARCPHIAGDAFIACHFEGSHSVHHFSSLQELDLSGCGRVGDRTAGLVARGCPQLRTLRMSACAQLTDCGLRLLAEGLREVGALTELQLSHCSGIADGGVVAMLRALPRLETLDLSFCAGVSAAVLHGAAEHSRALRSLDVTGNDRFRNIVTAAGSRRLSEQQRGTAAKQREDQKVAKGLAQKKRRGGGGDGGAGHDVGLASLRVLKFSELPQLTDPDVVGFMSSAAGVDHLELAGCARLTTSGLVHVALRCFALQHLDVSRCALLSDLGLIELAKNCPKLQTLVLDELPLPTDLTLAALGHYASALHTLSMRGNRRVTGLGLADAKMLSMRHLRLPGCSSLSPKGLRCIGLACPGLIELDAFTEAWHTPQLRHADVLDFARGRPHVYVGDPTEGPGGGCAHGDEMRMAPHPQAAAITMQEAFFKRYEVELRAAHCCQRYYRGYINRTQNVKYLQFVGRCRKRKAGRWQAASRMAGFARMVWQRRDFVRVRSRSRLATDIQRAFRGHRGRLFVHEMREFTAMAIRVQALARGWSCRWKDLIATMKVQKHMQDLERQMFGTVTEHAPGEALALEPVAIRDALADTHFDVKAELGMLPPHAPPTEEHDRLEWLARHIVAVLEKNNRWDPEKGRYSSLSAHGLASKFFEQSGVLIYKHAGIERTGQQTILFGPRGEVVINQDEEALKHFIRDKVMPLAPRVKFSHYTQFFTVPRYFHDPSPPLSRAAFLPVQAVPHVQYHGHKVCRLWNVGICPCERDEANPTAGVAHSHGDGTEMRTHVCAFCGNADHRLPECPVKMVKPPAMTVSDRMRVEAHRPECMRCTIKHAALFCANCGEAHCAECSAHIHSKENAFGRLERPHHQLVPVSANEAATCFCWECNELRNEMLIYGAAVMGTHEELRKRAADLRRYAARPLAKELLPSLHRAEFALQGMYEAVAAAAERPLDEADEMADEYFGLDPSEIAEIEALKKEQEAEAEEQSKEMAAQKKKEQEVRDLQKKVLELGKTKLKAGYVVPVATEAERLGSTLIQRWFHNLMMKAELARRAREHGKQRRGVQRHARDDAATKIATQFRGMRARSFYKSAHKKTGDNKTTLAHLMKEHTERETGRARNAERLYRLTRFASNLKQYQAAALRTQADQQSEINQLRRVVAENDMCIGALNSEAQYLKIAIAEADVETDADAMEARQRDIARAECQKRHIEQTSKTCVQMKWTTDHARSIGARRFGYAKLHANMAKRGIQWMVAEKDNIGAVRQFIAERLVELGAASQHRNHCEVFGAGSSHFSSYLTPQEYAMWGMACWPWQHFYRLHIMPKKCRAEIPWLHDVDKRCVKQLVRLDLEQEAELNRELDRLVKEQRGMVETEERNAEMMRMLHKAQQWERERNGLEKERLRVGAVAAAATKKGDVQAGAGAEAKVADFLEREMKLVAKLKQSVFSAEKLAKVLMAEDKQDVRLMEETVIFVENEPEHEWDPSTLDVIQAKPPPKRKRFSKNRWLQLHAQQPWQAEWLLAHKDEEKATGTLAIRRALDHHVHVADERHRAKVAEEARLAAEAEKIRLAEEAEAARLAKIAEQETAAIELGPKEDKTVPVYFRKKMKLGERIKRKVFAAQYARNAERLRIYRCVRDRQKVQVGFIPGMAGFKIICHQDENDAFHALQEEKEMKLMPFLQQAKHNIGFHFPVYIWFEETIKPKRYATHLEISHADPESKYYKDWGKEGYKMVGHPLLCGEKSDHVHSSFLIWWKNSPKEEPITHVAASYTADEEEFLRADGYVQVGEDMKNYGFAPGQLFWKKYKKVGEKVHASDLAGLKRELESLQMMLQATPTDKEIQHNIDVCEREIKTAEDELWEKEKRGLLKTPLEDATEFLALGPDEIGVLRKVFHKMDKNKSGDITVDEFCNMIGEKHTQVIDRIFVMLDGDGDSRLTFGEFVKAIGTFGMFGPPEMVRFSFSVFDPDGTGHINTENLEELLKMMHGPGFDVFAKQALHKFDHDKDGDISWKEYVGMNDHYPNLLFPAFRIQNNIYKKCMGVSWWMRRKDIFHAARMSISPDEVAEKDIQEQKRRNGMK
jgi:F-box/leucine-rich repeat protein 2/20